MIRARATGHVHRLPVAVQNESRSLQHAATHELQPPRSIRKSPGVVLRPERRQRPVLVIITEVKADGIGLTRRK